MIAIRRLLIRSVSITGLLAGAVLLAPASLLAQDVPEIARFAATAEPPVFDSAEAAVDAFKTALTAPDMTVLARLLGLDIDRLKADENAAATFALLGEGAARQLVVEDAGDRKILLVGQRVWPLPFPLVKGDDGKWAFDTFAGLEEIVNRHVGENELEAIATMRAYVDAQNDYAARDRDGDGVAEYAQKLVSTEGMTDGLYWASDEENGESPAGGAVSQAELDDAAKGEGYFGYRFRVLAGQGDRIAGGAYDYVVNGNMIGGFALLGWPVKYGETGVKTFVVSRDGIVYEADLGAATEAIVAYIDRFNPDQSWSMVRD